MRSAKVDLSAFAMIEVAAVQQKGSHPDSGPEQRESLLLRVSKYLAIGLEFPSTVIGGMVLGYLLDIYFDTSPWLTVSFTLFSFVGACVRLVQLVRRFSRENR